MAYSGWGATLVYAGALFIQSYGLSTAQAGVLLGVAAREGEARTFDAPGLQELHLQGLGPETAGALLAAHGDGLSPEVHDRLVGSTRGNPLALRELPGLLSEDQLAGREPLADPLPVGPTLQAAFLELARNLPAESQAVLLIAAADDTGDPAAVLRGARELRIEAAAFGAAERRGSCASGSPPSRFRHPLVRSAIYQGASLPERQEVHEMLADILEGDEFADPRAWHRAAATSEANDEIAEELERAAERARRRSGHATAAAAVRARGWDHSQRRDARPSSLGRRGCRLARRTAAARRRMDDAAGHGFEHSWIVGTGSILAGDSAKGMSLLREAVAVAEGSRGAIAALPFALPAPGGLRGDRRPAHRRGQRRREGLRLTRETGQETAPGITSRYSPESRRCAAARRSAALAPRARASSPPGTGRSSRLPP
jgi:hypothetical protein